MGVDAFFALLGSLMFSAAASTARDMINILAFATNFKNTIQCKQGIKLEATPYIREQEQAEA